MALKPGVGMNLKNLDVEAGLVVSIVSVVIGSFGGGDDLALLLGGWTTVAGGGDGTGARRIGVAAAVGLMSGGLTAFGVGHEGLIGGGLKATPVLGAQGRGLGTLILAFFCYRNKKVRTHRH